MANPTGNESRGSEKPPLPLPDPDEVRHTFDVAMAKIRERQGFYTGLALIALLVAVAAIFVANLDTSEPPSDFSALWKRANRVREKLSVNRSARQEIAELTAYLEQSRGSETEGHALWLLGIYHYREAWTPDKATAADRKPDLEKSISYLERIQADKRFEDLLVTKRQWFNESAVPPTDQLLRQVRDDLKWSEENAYVEPLPSPSPVAVLRTSAGDVHLQFFGDLAPEHVRNFLTLARKGTYNETYFHFVRKDPTTGEARGVMAGDPYTFFYNDPFRKQDILRWGTGGVGYEIAPEGARYRIAHRRGIVTSQARSQADWDNGVQFMIMTGTDQDLDKHHTPFAKVVEGMGIVDKFGQRRTASAHPTYKDEYDFGTVATKDLLVDPPTIHKVIVYENGTALQHDFPLDEGEKSIATLAQTPVKPLEGDALYGGRRLRAHDGEGEIRIGLDIPFPDDVDPAKADPAGARVARTNTPESATPGQR